jgi:Flp pilus assembly protein TadG
MLKRAVSPALTGIADKFVKIQQGFFTCRSNAELGFCCFRESLPDLQRVKSVMINVFSRIKRTCRKVSMLFARDESGIAAMEFGFIALPFFAILVAIFQIGIIFLAQNELETAVEKAGRQLLTGQVQKGGVTQAQFLTSICANLPVFFTCSSANDGSGVMVDVSLASSFASASTTPPALTYDKNGNVSNSWSYNTGAAGSILVLRIFYQFPVFLGPLGLNLANLPGSKHLMVATSVFQVEPYSAVGSGS